jgi:hypothetical protein
MLRLFYRAELASSILLSLACSCPSSLRAHHPHLELLLDYPDALYPVVLHRLSLCIATASPVDKIVKDCRKMLTMGSAAAKKTALLLAAHVMRTGGEEGGRAGQGEAEDGRQRVDGLLEYGLKVMDAALESVMRSLEGEAGAAGIDGGAWGGGVGSWQFVLDGDWDLSCVALDALSYASQTTALPADRTDAAFHLHLKPVVGRLQICSHQVSGRQQQQPPLSQLAAHPHCCATVGCPRLRSASPGIPPSSSAISCPTRCCLQSPPSPPPALLPLLCPAPSSSSIHSIDD